MKLILKILLLIPFLVFAQDSDGPRIRAWIRDWDFGDIREGQIVSHNFKIKNIGKKDLVIEKVHSSCGCTATNASKSIIPPGDSTIIHAEFNSTNRKGPQKKDIDVFTNDASFPKLKLTIHGTVYGKNDNIELIKKGPRLQLRSNQIRFQDVKKGEIIETKIDLKNTGKKPLIISEIKSSCDCIKVFADKYQIQPNEMGSAFIKIDTSELQGTVARTIVIRSNDQIDPNQVITAFISLTKDK